ncbi:hypothetical protein AZ22_1278 [Bordetella bronchiseptica 980-2]|nr:hypothetical protein AZ22_1278 [Bordetella bronchiseptica 980-2]KAK68896.1 hypothetical protein L530_0128 [Bordetella bronchiseptica MO211]KCV49020.1 hypothetical protein L491_0128 [Bordetella bronchiseptica 3E44]KCV56014.1 hypothetical protein AZ14_0138 [Bordetella bronchiseptica 980]KDB86345.1 hypothetical protein AZ27_0127 [Bordetella bronchiseptica D756]KDB94131.1 hypothetical protein AZ17_0130 [Bordetella bronchiseptica D989]KDC38371.1 hypothetical protein L508_0130 [Bordetella bronch
MIPAEEQLIIRHFISVFTPGEILFITANVGTITPDAHRTDGHRRPAAE